MFWVQNVSRCYSLTVKLQFLKPVTKLSSTKLMFCLIVLSFVDFLFNYMYYIQTHFILSHTNYDLNRKSKLITNNRR